MGKSAVQERKGRSAIDTAVASFSQPSPGDVRDQLARILNSSEFVIPERGRALLRYLVDQTLAGHADRLKGYTIGTVVFERDDSFDSQADPVVRTEAAKLRRALERYYLVAGQADPVLIEVPKGGYAPKFTQGTVLDAKPPVDEESASVRVGPVRPVSWRAAAALLCLVVVAAGVGIQQMRGTVLSGAAMVPALPDSPTLMVMSFASLGEGDEATLYAAGVTEEVLTKLSRFKDLTVLGQSGGNLPAASEPQFIGREVPARYLVTGSLRLSGPMMRVTSRLVDTITGAALWAQTYEEDLRVRGLFAVQEDIADHVASAIAQPYGVVFRSELRRTADQSPAELGAYACTLRFYVYWADPSPESHALVRKCLERALARFPGYATAWAMLSIVTLDEDRFAFNRQPGEPGPIDRALQMARRAVDLDADNARGLQALLMVLFFRGEVDEAERIGEQALAANPHDSALLAEFGLRTALAGELQRGREYVERALARDPAYAGYCHSALALIAYLQGDNDRAEFEIRRADLAKFSLYHAIAAVIYAERGLMSEARREAALFTKLHPTLVANIDSELRKRNLRPEFRARLILGLLQAGVPVPADASAAANQLYGAR